MHKSVPGEIIGCNSHFHRLRLVSLALLTVAGIVVGRFYPSIGMCLYIFIDMVKFVAGEMIAIDLGLYCLKICRFISF